VLVLFIYTTRLATKEIIFLPTKIIVLSIPTIIILINVNN